MAKHHKHKLHMKKGQSGRHAARHRGARQKPAHFEHNMMMWGANRYDPDNDGDNDTVGDSDAATDAGGATS